MHARILPETDQIGRVIVSNFLARFARSTSYVICIKSDAVTMCRSRRLYEHYNTYTTKTHISQTVFYLVMLISL